MALPVKQHIVKKTLIIISVLFASILACAQTYELGGWGGVSYYLGDLNTNFDMRHPGPAGGLFGRYNFNDRLAVKLGANYTRLGYKDEYSKYTWQKARNLSFETDVVDANIQFEFHFLRYIHGSRDHFFTPYLFGGAGAYFFDPRAELNGEWYHLQQMGTEGQGKNEEYSLVQPALNYGIGFKFDLNFFWSLNLEISGRRLFTDYFDDVSHKYVDAKGLASDRGAIAPLLADRSYEVVEAPIGMAGRQRGDSQSRDMFGFIGIGIAYNFANVKCPGF